MPVETVTPQQLKDLFEQESPVRLIDVRPGPEFREVHVVGARNIPFSRLSADHFDALANENGGSPVYFICKAGKKSLEVSEQAVAHGLPKVRSVDGGTEACTAAGLPVERGPKAVSVERQVRITAGALAMIGGVLAITTSPYWGALPAFIGAGLIYAGVTDTCGMASVLAKMPWNQ